MIGQKKRKFDSTDDDTLRAENKDNPDWGDAQKWPTDWQQALSHVIKTKEYENLISKIKQMDKTCEIFPIPKDRFQFMTTRFSDIKCVIIGQDPYHGPHQAHGLCFSVLPGQKIPPSLKNIYKELASNKLEPPFVIPNHGYLIEWAKQGVLLLNACLTVTRGKPNSHQKLGWEYFTNAIIESIAHNNPNVAFLLWGGFARKMIHLIQDSDVEKRCLILQADHPSPLSVHRGGWFGKNHFSLVNEWLREKAVDQIDWNITSL